MTATEQSSQRPISHKRVLTIAAPIVLSNATVPILGAVDTGVVGQLGEAAPIGAVGIGAIVLASIYWIFGFLRMGTAGLTAQAHGAGQTGEVSAMLTRAVLIGFGAGITMIALQVPIFWAAFALAPASTEVETLARDYMEIRIFSAPAAIGIYAITGWLVALERTRGVFVIQLWMNGLNIVLDLIFVLQLGWGVEGVAIATFIAEWSGLALGIYLCRDAFDTPAWKDWSRIFDRARLVRLASVNGDILIRSVLLQISFTSFLFFGARFGDVTLAANQVLLQFLFVTSYAMDGFAFAAEALVGQALGARDRARLRRSAILTTFWAGVVGAFLAMMFLIFGGMIIDIMTTAPAVQAEARTYLIYMIIGPFVGVAAWMFDGIYIGATRTRDMRNMMALSFVVYCLCLAALMPALGNHGLWLSLLIMFVVRGITLGWRYPALEAVADTPPERG